MSAKMGRPKIKNPKDNSIRFRADESIIEKLNACCNATGLSKSEIIRLGIEKVYQEEIDKRS